MRLMLDNTSSTPLYQQIMQKIRVKILSGELRPGEPLPTMRQLASDLLISVITTKRAYQELESQGLIVTRPGRGTFVREFLNASVEQLKDREVEEKLRDAVKTAKRLGVNADTLHKALKMAMETEGFTDE